MLRLERRSTPSPVMLWLAPVLAFAITLGLAAALFAVLGKDPVRGLQIFVLEPFNGLYGLGELAVKGAPLVLCAVGLSICFRANVWNIGAEGQLVAGAIAGGWMALQADASSPSTYFLLVMLAGALGGMTWAAITAWLRDRFNTNEILVSLMLTYVAQLLLSYLVFGPWKDPAGFNFPQTASFAQSALSPRLMSGMRAHAGLIVALLAVIAGWLLMSRSYAGYRLQVGGIAPMAARYAGYSSRQSLWLAMMVCGAMAGLAGIGEAAGAMQRLTASVSPGYGFAAIIVAFLGRLHPIGVVPAAVVMAMFYIGGELAQSRLGLPSSITGVFQGLLLASLLACDVLVTHRVRRRRPLAAGA